MYVASLYAVNLLDFAVNLLYNNAHIAKKRFWQKTYLTRALQFIDKQNLSVFFLKKQSIIRQSNFSGIFLVEF